MTNYLSRNAASADSRIATSRGDFTSKQSDDEDWTKMTDTTSRRRIQNRIAQRNRRENLRKQREHNEARRSATSSPSLKATQANSLVWVNKTVHPKKASRKKEHDHTELESHRKESSRAAPTFTTQLSPQSMDEAQQSSRHMQKHDSTARGMQGMQADPPFVSESYSQDMSLEATAQLQPLTPASLEGLDQNYWYNGMNADSFSQKPLDFSPLTFKSFGEACMNLSDFPRLCEEDCAEAHQVDNQYPKNKYQNIKSPTSYLPAANPKARCHRFLADTPSQDRLGIRHQPTQTLPQSAPTGSVCSIDSSDPCNPTGYTALHLATKKGHLSILRLLLTTTDLPIDALDACGLSPLHLAILENQPSAAHLLLDQGANSDLCTGTGTGQTALHLAVERGDADLVRLLLEYTADPEARNCSGRTALHCAVEAGQEEIVRLMLDSGIDSLAKVEL
ncbi:MAG: hypothetical protein Q9227_006204 [Pyrenula ochraceoflavens]